MAVTETAHQPVMVKEVLDFLAPVKGGVYVDATLGAAGHSLAVLTAAGSGVSLLGLDQDEEIIEIAKKRLKPFESKVRIVHANFSEILEIVKEENLLGVDGVLADLGVSSLQFDRAERGFSFSKEGPLDMRMNPKEGETVLEKLEQTNEMELTRVLKEYGEERLAAKIARALLEKMKRGELQTTKDIEETVWLAYPPSQRHKGIHPATRTFQALRIWVNGELEALKKFLKSAPSVLKEGGRLVVISYHSLEDRLVKHTFRDLSKGDESFRVLTKKPVTPSVEEVEKNPRSRSAKLRALERLH
ncbi:MAG: 16S rRNA (cytosine(1402)-N(4))-methyltransferase RsmH [Deltaproteobacteria bacterium]|nr:16S rRNA (cytosine(1402)-N(4))-methyltransferase RsmH [Deltaproteobacteria bacterium]